MPVEPQLANVGAHMITHVHELELGPPLPAHLGAANERAEQPEVELEPSAAIDDDSPLTEPEGAHDVAIERVSVRDAGITRERDLIAAGFREHGTE